jgi:hypothetical protein
MKNEIDINSPSFEYFFDDYWQVGLDVKKFSHADGRKSLKYKIEEFYYFNPTDNTVDSNRHRVVFVYIENGFIKKRYSLQEAERILKLNSL